MRLDLPYLMADTDRHGNERLFVRRFGRKIQLREKPGTAAFASAYSTALEALGCQETSRPAGRAAAPVGSFWMAGGLIFCRHRIYEPAGRVADRAPRDLLRRACVSRSSQRRPTCWRNVLSSCYPPPMSACCATAGPTSRARQIIA